VFVELQINQKFKKLIPPLLPEELAQLEQNLLDEGCRDPLVVWNGVLLDGHNRYAICKRHSISFNTVPAPPYIQTEDDASDWIDKNQLGRRNLSPDAFKLLLGRRYNRTKKNDGQRGPQKLDQNEPASTAEKIAKEHGVSAATVKRAAKFAEEVERKPELQEAIARNEPVSKAIRETKRKEIIERLENIETKAVKAVEGVYDVIVIDPPWPMQKIERDLRPNQSEFDYPTMSIEEISELKIPSSDDCHLWLWTTQKFLPDAFSLLQGWGLKYVCAFVWHKAGGFQPIGLPQYNCEFVLYARKGAPAFIDTKCFFTCFDAPRGKHSEKPQEFYDVVRRVTAGRRIDMFNRKPIEGFDRWGNES
jgi:N6-adenosine-specific RNA methylase IME4